MRQAHPTLVVTNLLINFCVQLFVSWLVWRYYRTRVFSIDQKYSTFGPRFWTGVIDSCVLWPVSVLISLPTFFGAPPAVIASTVLMQNIVWLTYTIWMHARRGQTVGKIVCKVRVVDNATEGPLSVGQAVLRESIPLVVSIGLIVTQIRVLSSGILFRPPSPHPANVDFHSLWLAGAFPFLWFMAEIITMFTNDKRRALHDFIAGTCVIRTNVAEAVSSAPVLVDE